MRSIVTLCDAVRALQSADPDAGRLVDDIFSMEAAVGSLVVPESFREKVRKYFGARDENGTVVETEDEVIRRLEKQTIVRVRNRITGEEALFNSLRALRPGMAAHEVARERKEVDGHVRAAREGCDFCSPVEYTPEDVFGRVKGAFCCTCSNIAKYDAWSGLLIFQKHNPLTFDEHELGDYIETALRWFGEAHRRDASCTYPFLMWNCLEKAGASRVHGHAQLLLAKGVPYECPSRMFHAAETYRERCGRDYFGDLCKVHETLGLGVSEGSVCSFASLVPVKDKEIVVVSTDALKGNLTAVRAVYRALRCMIDKLGVTSFNCAVWFPPFGEESGRPTIVRVVDRGNIFKRPADMAAMELYGSSVIAADPYRVADALRGEG